MGLLSSAKGGKMGKKDIRLKVYLDDEDRYADLWNGSIFQGKQIIKAEDLEPVSPVLDAVMRQGQKKCFAMLL